MVEFVASTFVLAVNDVEVSRAFYCHQLGFVEDLRAD